MPLSKAQSRNLQHLRDITVRGYQRDDGCFDVEGHLIDTKPYSYPSEEHGAVQAGEPVHEMWIRMTVTEDTSTILLRGGDRSRPLCGVCPLAAPNFAGLAGLSIKSGFLRAATERIGGAKGCTHLREMLQQMATIAFQTVVGARARRQAAAGGRDRPVDPGEARGLLNSCYAYGSSSPVVQRRWPELYTGPVEAVVPSPSR